MLKELPMKITYQNPKIAFLKVTWNIVHFIGTRTQQKQAPLSPSCFPFLPSLSLFQTRVLPEEVQGGNVTSVCMYGRVYKRRGGWLVNADEQSKDKRLWVELWKTNDLKFKKPLEKMEDKKVLTFVPSGKFYRSGVRWGSEMCQTCGGSRFRVYVWMFLSWFFSLVVTFLMSSCC